MVLMLTKSMVMIYSERHKTVSVERCKSSAMNIITCLQFSMKVY